jgi:hypothetical protein
LCGKEKYQIIQDGRGRSKESGRGGRFGGQGKRAAQLREGDTLINKKSSDSNVLQCFGISRFSMSKVDVLKRSMEGKHLVII